MTMRSKRAVTVSILILLALAAARAATQRYQQREEEFRKQGQAEREKSGLSATALKEKYPTPEMRLVSAASVLPGVIKPIPLEEDERLAILEAFGGGERNLPSVRLPIREVRSALTGDEMILAEATTVKALERFDTLTPAIKRKLGGKTSFQRALADASRVSLEAFMKDRIRSDLIKAALASKLQVAIEAGSLANRPDEVQEIKLIIRGEDLSSIVEREQEV